MERKLDYTAKKDKGKPQLRHVPMQIVYDCAEVRQFAIDGKYKDPDNWKRVEIERYIDAMLRHMIEFVRNPEGKDKESGIEHYKHAACNMAFICELMMKD